MKLKVIEVIDKKAETTVNEFMSTVTVISASTTQVYYINAVVYTYHIFYEDRKPKRLPKPR